MKRSNRRTAHSIHPGITENTHGVPVTTMHVKDYYSTSRSRKLRPLVRALHGAQEQYLRKRPHKTFHSKLNIARSIVYSVPGIRAWAEYMPGGFATLYAHSPHITKLKNGKRLDPITVAFFKHSYDAVGLRTRSHIMGWLANKVETEDAPLKWLSLAAGTGKPVFDALHEMPDHIRRHAELFFIDSDSDVLDFAREIYIDESVNAATFETDTLDILQPGEIERAMIAFQPKVVDAMGLMEYLDDEQVAQCLTAVFEAMPTSCVFIFTNMTTHHPHLSVHKHALGWPGVIQRDTDDMMKIIFGSTPIPADCVSVYHDTEDVYNVYMVTKP